jgi:hypothetical protein
MADVQAALESYLADLPAQEFRMLCLRVRPPDEPLPPQPEPPTNLP